MIKNEFLNLYEELSELNEEYNPGPIAFEEIKKLIGHKKYSKAKIFGALKFIGIGLNKQFNSHMNWARQIQFMYNAWVTETITRDQLNDDKSALYAGIKEALAGTDYKLVPAYEFNDGKPNKHDELSIIGNNDHSRCIDCYDIKATNAESFDDRHYITSIEVKLQGQADTLELLLSKAHNAQIVVIFNLSKVVDIYVRKDIFEAKAAAEKYIKKATCLIDFTDQLIKIKETNYVAFSNWTAADAKNADETADSEEEPLTEKWIEDMNDAFVSKIWYSDSPSEFKAFIQAAAQNKVEGGYRLIVGKDFFCAAKASEMNHDSMCDFIDSNYLTTNLYGSEDTIIGFPKVIDYEQDNFENKDAYEWYLEGNFESNGQVPPEGLSYEEFVSWYDEVLDRFSDGRNSKIIVGKGFEIMLYNYKDIHTLEDFKTKTYIGGALASELVELKDRSASHITESHDLTEELPEWLVTGNNNGYLGIGLFDTLFGTGFWDGHEPSWVVELRNIFKEYGIDFKTNDARNFVATDASGENIILAFRAVLNKGTAYIKFEATSRMKINQLNPVWEYNAGINGKYSFHGNNYKKIDIDTQNAKKLAEKISTYYTNYNKHLENEKLFKEKYIGKTLIDLPITEDNIRFNPGNNGNMFPHFYVGGNIYKYGDKYWWDENRHKWYEVLNSQYKVREVDDSEIIK